ncbi:MAG: Asp-tRNA(Asn)/Glu-tRNA(Gln) amidotransferase subunit GatC [Patescibacteria group bacterium]
MIEEKDIDRLALLARLKLDAAEKAVLTKDIGSILGYVDQLAAAPLATDLATAPAIDPLTLNNLRADEPVSVAEEGLLQTKATDKAGYLKVKAIFAERS